MSTDKICPVCGATYGEDHVFCPRDSTALWSASAGDHLIGSVVGDRYLILERVGAGGMGEVYKAQDVRLQRPAAVKVLRAQLSLDLESLARFSREGANASKISNQYVAQVLDYGETEQGRPFLAMEFVPGESLKAILDREGALTSRRTTRLVCQIASALDSAHRLDVVHRDLKPENVLVCLDDAGLEQVKVVDFGISKVIRDDSQQVTSTGFVTGTREYMSPEQITGAPLDRRSDVYALGLVSYLMLTGSLPFAGSTPEHSMLLRLQEPPRRLRAVRPDISWPEDVQAVFDAALALDPSDRFASAGELAQALTGAVDMWLAEKRPAHRLMLRKPWMAIAAVLAFGAAGALGYRATREPLPPRVAPDPVEFSEQATGSAESGVVSEPSTPQEPPVAEESRPEPPAQGPRPPEPRPRPPVEPKAPNATLDLKRYGAILLQPELPPDSARRIIATLDALLARLTSRSDSVQVDIYRAEAYALAGDGDHACAILDAARARGTPRQREKIELWEARELCKFSDWTSS